MHVTVTAGHGGTDPGNTWNGHHEAKLMMQLRHILAAKLRSEGHIVREDGGRGENWALSDAMRLIAGSTVALELHTNASTNQSATGVEVVSLPEHRELSQRVAHAIGSVLNIPTRRDKGWFPHAQCAAERGFEPGFSKRGGLIVEVFFQSNPEDLRKYLERYWLVASAIARAIQ
ncbi:N-acetylmuramoyl-L-alanine amidase [Hydrogenophaga sp.]|uniref:N-acetylmuramoyl-L-alanine amidase n=1 Tax=Hydrogenophaga sp. TaxID=1904254 RepID=UPI00271B0D83|nr:N-acetylmuramoyl-L-alanine amidase [Hydrogenophaga sp.]MDO8903954.1 N-acetylmuramoyl-L-alanine amidase [Hydrogenophaga sp.]